MLVRAPRVGRHLFERCGSRGRERDKSIEEWRKDPGPAERKLFWPKRQERETRLNGNLRCEISRMDNENEKRIDSVSRTIPAAETKKMQKQ